MVVDVQFPDGHKIQEPGNPIKFSETPGETFAPPPPLGQNTREVLTKILKYPEEKVDQLEREEVII